MSPKLLYGIPLSLLVCFLTVLVLVVTYLRTKRPVNFSNGYTVIGTMNLPYAGISEPFTAWYDGNSKRSRIDYYNGTVKTFYLENEGLFGSAMEIVPVTTESVFNQPTCFRSNGTRSDPVKTQDVLPDFSGDFYYVGIETMKDHHCEKWRKVVTNYNRTSTYTIWLRWQGTETPMVSHAIPVRYEMIGYDTLMQSHYDHYYLDYEQFILDIPDSKFFKPPPDVSCGKRHNLSDPNAYHYNPMKELISGQADHVDNAWENYKTAHSKSYTDQEHDQRKEIFRNNLRFIHSTNRQGLGFMVKVNNLADWNNKDYGRLKGKLHVTGYNGGAEFPYSHEMVEELEKNLPQEFDWRNRGAVTPVKDQAICGSCWSFGATGTVEGAYFLKTGHLTNFSEQALVDCSWGEGNRGCDGGEDFLAFQWSLKHGGIPSHQQYGQYLGQDGYCHSDNVTMRARIDKYVNVTSGNVKALRLALHNHGPVSVSIDASHDTFKFYSSGLYYNPNCQSKLDNLDHTVLAVGYGSFNGTDYWIIKNSWSAYWGHRGYVLMATKNCGVETMPHYVELL